MITFFNAFTSFCVLLHRWKWINHVWFKCACSTAMISWFPCLFSMRIPRIYLFDLVLNTFTPFATLAIFCKNLCTFPAMYSHWAYAFKVIIIFWETIVLWNSILRFEIWYIHTYFILLGLLRLKQIMLRFILRLFSFYRWL